MMIDQCSKFDLLTFARESKGESEFECCSSRDGRT